MPKLQPGNFAPDFKLQDADENWVTLKDLLAKGPIMLAFYPGDFTAVCTKQLCGYQNVYERFEGQGVQVVGISHDAPEKHREFRKAHGLKFPLLSDPGKEVTKAYGVTSSFLLGAASRGIFVIGRDGRILHAHVEATPITHRKADQVLEVLQSLKSHGQL